MMGEYGPLNMTPPLLYRAALRGRFGKDSEKEASAS